MVARTWSVSWHRIGGGQFSGHEMADRAAVEQRRVVGSESHSGVDVKHPWVRFGVGGVDGSELGGSRLEHRAS